MVIIMKLLLACIVANFASAQQGLVITGLVAYPSKDSSTDSGFNVVKMTACSGIADLAQYTLAEYSTTQTSPFQVVTFGDDSEDPISIPKGATIYASQLSISDFHSFFGFVPGRYIATDLDFIGTDNLALRYNEATTVDAYGIIGVDDSNTKADFGNGWAVRKSNTSASGVFNVSDWVIQPGAYSSFPAYDSQSDTPVAWGNYTCGEGGANSASSSPALSPKPTNAGRSSGDHDGDHDHHRAPAAPKTPAPVTLSPSTLRPVVQPTPNPKRPKVRGHGHPVVVPTFTPVVSPTIAPVVPTKAPVPLPTKSPLPPPTSAPILPPSCDTRSLTHKHQQLSSKGERVLGPCE